MGCTARRDVASYVFGDQKTLDMFLSAKQVTAERLHLKERTFPRELSNYNRGSAVILSTSQTQDVQRLFSDAKAYTWNHLPKRGVVREKLCLPNYGVLLSFRVESHVVDVALCFECDLFAVFVDGGRVNREEDLDLVRPQLVGLVKALFPHDDQIRSLSPERQT
jgi:hypothetical protein